MTTLTNYCKREMMSVCTASDHTEQESCVFYKKASIKDKCRYLKFNEYCDCLGAQIDAQPPFKEQKEVIK